MEGEPVCTCQDYGNAHLTWASCPVHGKPEPEPREDYSDVLWMRLTAAESRLTALESQLAEMTAERDQMRRQSEEAGGCYYVRESGFWKCGQLEAAEAKLAQAEAAIQGDLNAEA
jgi:hypothetical protein